MCSAEQGKTYIRKAQLITATMVARGNVGAVQDGDQTDGDPKDSSWETWDGTIDFGGPEDRGVTIQLHRRQDVRGVSESENKGKESGRRLSQDGQMKWKIKFMVV